MVILLAINSVRSFSFLLSVDFSSVTLTTALETCRLIYSSRPLDRSISSFDVHHFDRWIESPRRSVFSRRGTRGDLIPSRQCQPKKRREERIPSLALYYRSARRNVNIVDSQNLPKSTKQQHQRKIKRIPRTRLVLVEKASLFDIFVLATSRVFFLIIVSTPGVGVIDYLYFISFFFVHSLTNYRRHLSSFTVKN